jgi:hypothetical protein
VAGEGGYGRRRPEETVLFRRKLHGAEGTQEAATALTAEQLAEGFIEELK